MLLSREKYWTEADSRTIPMEEVKSNLEENKEDVEQGNQMEQQMIVLRDSLLQFGGPS
jgi:hypothetical protein